MRPRSPPHCTQPTTPAHRWSVTSIAAAIFVASVILLPGKIGKADVDERIEVASRVEAELGATSSDIRERVSMPTSNKPSHCFQQTRVRAWQAVMSGMPVELEGSKG